MAQQPTRNTVTYRTVNGVDLEFDYILPEKREGKEDKLGVVVWFHGGGLIQGTRKNLYPHLASAAQKHNLCFISADYRLAPQTRFPAILSDLTSLFSFILSSKFDDLTSGRVDTKRLVTIGNSAGGWLSLLVGLRIGFEESGEKYEERLKDCIRGVVGIYPITSVEHKFWHEKQRPVSYMDRVIEADELKEYLDPNSKEVNGNEGGDRNKMYSYMIQEAILQNLLLDGTNVDPAAYTVAKAIRAKETVSPLPPIYLIHGTADDKVPHSQTVEVVDELKQSGHDSVTYDEREGKDHSFDASEEEEMSDLWKWIVERLQE